MIFTLEALDARHGDSLILHYRASDDPAAKPQFMVIDGGPSSVYGKNLRPRLNALKQKWFPDDALPIRLLMVSHVDDDHLNGVIALAADLRDKVESSSPLPYQIQNLWYNSFDNILGNGALEQFSNLGPDATIASVEAMLPSGTHINEDVAAVVATVGQGRELRDHVKLLEIEMNRPFTGLVMSRTPKPAVVTWKDGPKFTVLCPAANRIADLHEEWEKALKKAKAAGDPSVLVAAYTDDSVFNLASIVVLAEMGGKSMLLTGDARGDDILEGLSTAKLLNSKGIIKVDILKLPHHGSDRNVSTDFFRKVLAKHYVVSADGAHDNPDMTTLDMIAEARSDNDFAIHLTNGTGKKNLGQKLANFLAAKEAKGRTYKVLIRTGPSIMINLLKEVNY